MIEILTQEIRKSIPNLIEFTNGCLFTIKDEYLPKELSSKVCQVTDIFNSEWESKSFVFVQESISKQQFFKDKKLFNTKNPYIYEIFGRYDYDEYESQLEDFVDIIGKEPMLNDVLNWLKFLNVDDENILTIFKLWNLNNPYLKNQNKELFSYLIIIFENKKNNVRPRIFTRN